MSTTDEERACLVYLSIGLIFVALASSFAQFYYCVKFVTTASDDPILNKTFPNLIKIFNILMILTSLIHHPCVIIAEISPLQFSHPSLANQLSIFCLYLCLIMIYLCNFLSMTRYWLMHYELHCCTSDMNKKWKIYLNESVINNDFWLSYRNILGSEKYMVSIMLSIAIFLSITHSALFYMFMNIEKYGPSLSIEMARNTMAIVDILPVFFIAAIYRNVPLNLESVYYFRYELKSMLIYRLMIAPFAFSFLTFCTVNLNFVNDRDNDDNTNTIIITNIVRITMFIFAAFGATLVNTCWMYRKHQNETKIDVNNHRHQQQSSHYNGDNYDSNSQIELGEMELGTMQNSSVPHSSSSEICTSSSTQCVFEYKTKQRCTLPHVLLNQGYFELFVQFLGREFSTENILCFIEMVQFKYVVEDAFNLYQLLQNNYRLNSHSSNNRMKEEEEEKKVEGTNQDYFDYYSCNLRLNPSIPTSSLIYNKIEHFGDLRKMNESMSNEEIMNYILKIMHSLYLKYIKMDENIDIDINITNSSSIIVNISGPLRQSYDDDMDFPINEFLTKNKNMEPMEIFEYFDVIIEEMYDLLKASFNRFITTNNKKNISHILLPTLSDDYSNHYGDW